MEKVRECGLVWWRDETNREREIGSKWRQCLSEEKPQGGNLQTHGARLELSLQDQMQLVFPHVLLGKTIGACAKMVGEILR